MDYSFWLQLHSGVRWLVVLAFILVIVKYALGTVQGSVYGALDKRLMSTFSILAIIQWLIGVGVIIGAAGVYSSIQGIHWLHMLVMTVAVGSIASASGRTRRADDDSKFRTGLIGTLISALIIIVGVAIVGGW